MRAEPASNAAASQSIGVDIGGTFTDLVLFDPTSRSLTKEKVLTTPDDPSEGVLSGIRQLLAKAGSQPGRVGNVIHGTTLVANALIERKGVKTALLTTAGFRDVLEIGREIRYDTYDLDIVMPRPLVERDQRHEVSERISAQGNVLVPFDPASVERLLPGLAASKVRAIAVCLLHAYRNASHEAAVRALLTERLPGIDVAISSEVMPAMGEYERTSTTVCNAYVQPIVSTYLETLARGIASLGISGGLFLMLSDGGNMHSEGAKRFPIRLVQSGPAGGVRAAAAIGEMIGIPDILCFDMGGTTAKACLIESYRPVRTTDFEVARVWRFKKGSGLPLKVPVVDMIEIGAGGGSIAGLDGLGFIQVGPESASSVPGPACYGFGGERPTVTDADLVLGYLHESSFLGGDMALHKALSQRAIEDHIARPAGIGIIEAAWNVFETVTETMAQAATVHALEKGKKLADYVMVAIGGAGPVHAWSVAQRTGITKVICPSGAGVASAFGFLAAPLSFEVVRGDAHFVNELEPGRVANLIDELTEEASKLLLEAGVTRDRISLQISCSARYAGQGYEVEFALPRETFDEDAAKAIRQRFEQRYLDLYGRHESIEEIEIMSWMVRAVGPPAQFRPGHHRERAGPTRQHAPRRRSIYFGNVLGMLDASVVERDGLDPGDTVAGPAAIEERECTIIVPPGALATIDEVGNVVIAL